MKDDHVYYAALHNEDIPKYHKIISHKKDLSKVMFSLLFSILLWPCYGTMMYRQECSHGQAWLQPEQCECREAEV